MEKQVFLLTLTLCILCCSAGKRSPHNDNHVGNTRHQRDASDEILATATALITVQFMDGQPRLKPTEATSVVLKKSKRPKTNMKAKVKESTGKARSKYSDRKMWISKRSLSSRHRKPIRSPLRITIPLPRLYRNRRTIGLPLANPQPDQELLPGYIKPQAPVSKQSVPAALDTPGLVSSFANTGADSDSAIADDPNDPDDDDDPNGEDQDEDNSPTDMPDSTSVTNTLDSDAAPTENPDASDKAVAGASDTSNDSPSEVPAASSFAKMDDSDKVNKGTDDSAAGTDVDSYKVDKDDDDDKDDDNPDGADDDASPTEASSIEDAPTDGSDKKSDVADLVLGGDKKSDTFSSATLNNSTSVDDNVPKITNIDAKGSKRELDPILPEKQVTDTNTIELTNNNDALQKSDISDTSGSRIVKTDTANTNTEITNQDNVQTVSNAQVESPKIDSAASTGTSESGKVTELAASKRDLKDSLPIDEEEEKIVKELLGTKTEPGIEDASLRSLENDINSLDLSKKSEIESLSRIIRNKMHRSNLPW